MNIGEIFPVDGIAIHASDIEIDESSITGESDLINKIGVKEMGENAVGSPFIISGSKMITR